MIGKIVGLVDEILGGTAIVMTSGGVGYAILIPARYENELTLGKPVDLKIYTHVREDAILLFGFLTSTEKKLFEILLDVQGIGPKLGLNILSDLTPAAFISAFNARDKKTLGIVSGLGSKIIERLFVELPKKLENFAALEGLTGGTLMKPTAGVDSQSMKDALDALEALGFMRTATLPHVKEIYAKQPQASASDVIQRVLKKIGH